jgi:hypothetical protein
MSWILLQLCCNRVIDYSGPGQSIEPEGRLQLQFTELSEATEAIRHEALVVSNGFTDCKRRGAGASFIASLLFECIFAADPKIYSKSRFRLFDRLNLTVHLSDNRLAMFDHFSARLKRISLIMLMKFLGVVLRDFDAFFETEIFAKNKDRVSLSSRMVRKGQADEYSTDASSECESDNSDQSLSDAHRSSDGIGNIEQSVIAESCPYLYALCSFCSGFDLTCLLTPISYARDQSGLADVYTALLRLCNEINRLATKCIKQNATKLKKQKVFRCSINSDGFVTRNYISQNSLLLGASSLNEKISALLILVTDSKPMISKDDIEDGNARKYCRSSFIILPHYHFSAKGSIRRRKKRLRSRNTVIDGWLEDESGNDDMFADLEDFLVP